MPTTVVRVPVADPAAKTPFFDPTQPGPLRDEIFGQAYLEDYARRLAAASEALGESLAAHPGLPLVAVRSTVPPGTTETVVIPALERSSGRSAALLNQNR